MAEARWGCVAASSDWGFCCLSLLPVRMDIIEEILRLDLIEPESLSCRGEREASNMGKLQKSWSQLGPHFFLTMRLGIKLSHLPSQYRTDFQTLPPSLPTSSQMPLSPTEMASVRAKGLARFANSGEWPM